MNIDRDLWARFTGEALAGLASRPIHDQAGPIDPKTKQPGIIPGAPAGVIGARAVELGRAAAEAFQAAQEEAPEEAKPPKRPR